MPLSNGPADRRHEHVPLDTTALEPFLLGRRVFSATLLDDGKSNSNYELALDNGLHCVVRLHSRPTAGLETYVAGLVRDRVPVPDLLFAGDSLTVWEFVPGRPMRDDPAEVRAAAAVLAKIWETKFEAPGELLPGGAIKPWPFGDGDGFTEQMLRHPNVRRYLGPELFQGVAQLLEQGRRRPKESFNPPHLVHGDFNPTNVLIHDGRVSAVIDWEYAHSGGPWGDIGNLRRHISAEHRHAMADGLADGGFDAPKDWEWRAAFADLGSHLEFLTSARSDAFKATRVELVRELLELRS